MRETIENTLQEGKISADTSTTAGLFVRPISIASTFLDTLINVSWFTEGAEGKNQPHEDRWKDPLNTDFAVSS